MKHQKPGLQGEVIIRLDGRERKCMGGLLWGRGRASELPCGKQKSLSYLDLILQSVCSSQHTSKEVRGRSINIMLVDLLVVGDICLARDPKNLTG